MMAWDRPWKGVPIIHQILRESALPFSGAPAAISREHNSQKEHRQRCRFRDANLIEDRVGAGGWIHHLYVEIAGWRKCCPCNRIARETVVHQVPTVEGRS